MQAYVNQLLVVLVPVLAPFLAALYRLLASKIPASPQLESVVHSAVHAAEQLYADIPGSGQAKRQFVISRIEAIFGKRVNAALLEVLLESAVEALPPSVIAPQQPSSLV